MRQNLREGGGKKTKVFEFEKNPRCDCALIKRLIKTNDAQVRSAPWPSGIADNLVIVTMMNPASYCASGKLFERRPVIVAQFEETSAQRAHTHTYTQREERQRNDRKSEWGAVDD